MANKLRDELAEKVESIAEVGKGNLELMRLCCGRDLPFYLSSEMDSTAEVSEDCLRKMHHCFEFCKQIADLKEHKEKGHSTMVVLILMRYGSIEIFKHKMEEAFIVFDRRLEDLQDSIERICMILEKRAFRCSECHGGGYTSRTVYVRDRGTPTQPILQTSECDCCKGKGEFRLTVPLTKTLAQFKKNADVLFKVLTNVCDLFKDFNHKFPLEI